ncbi:hypothetical protein J0H58_21610 [bacterium]|nr:hypothetical protein [bacterium]
MGITFGAVRQGFFTNPDVAKGITAQKKRAFSKAGAFIRQRARTSIRRRKKSSPPGQPPSAHHPTGLKLIFFAWSEADETVVVGSVQFKGARGPKLGAKLLEHGGDATVQGKRGPRRLTYRGNPFMKPAALAELPKFAGLFKSSPGA